MGTFPELLRFRAGLMDDAYKFPGLLQHLQTPQEPQQGAPQPQAMPQAPPQPQAAPEPSGGGGGGFGGAMGNIFGGMDDPRLTPEQNAEARKQAMLQAGLAILASPESGIRAIAQGGMYGQQVGAGIREQTYGRTQQERIQNALSDPEVMGRMPPELRALLPYLPPEQATKAIIEVMTAPLGETKLGKPGDWIIGPDGVPTMQLGGVIPDAASILADSALKTAYAENGLTEATFQQQPPQIQQVVIERANAIRREASPKGSQVSVNTAEGMAGANVDSYKTVVSDARTASDNLQTLGLMREVVGSGLPQGKLEEATLGLRGYATELGMANADTIGKQQLFAALGNALTLGKAEQLTGPKSDNDILFLKSILPQLANTAEGNALMIEALMKQEQRKVEQARFWDRYASTHNGSLVGVVSDWADYAEANPIHYDDLLQKAAAILKLDPSDPAWGTR